MRQPESMERDAPKLLVEVSNTSSTSLGEMRIVFLLALRGES
jgi:hypothetical protein